MSSPTGRLSTHPGAHCSIQGCNAPAPWEMVENLPGLIGIRRMYWLCGKHFNGVSVPKDLKDAGETPLFDLLENEEP